MTPRERISGKCHGEKGNSSSFFSLWVTCPLGFDLCSRASGGKVRHLIQDLDTLGGSRFRVT